MTGKIALRFDDFEKKRAVARQKADDGQQVAKNEETSDEVWVCRRALAAAFVEDATCWTFAWQKIS